MKAKKIDALTLSILSAATYHDNELRLPATLDRGIYANVKRVVEAAGGKWDRRAAAHVFPGPADEALEPLLLTGEIIDKKKLLGQFYTPDDVARIVVEFAQIGSGMRVLEPNAGSGQLLRACQKAGHGDYLRWCEIDPKVAAETIKEFPRGKCVDFLSLDPKRYLPFDRVVMNPPFAPAQADIDHVQHALKFLRPGGRLAAIMSNGIGFRRNRKTTDFIASLPNHMVHQVREKAFLAAGTAVRTVILTVQL